MFTRLIGSIAITTLLAIAPAAAMDVDCTNANMTKANTSIEKMASGEKKTEAMKEMAMAKESMAKKEMAQCKTHMNKAMKMEM